MISTIKKATDIVILVLFLFVLGMLFSSGAGAFQVIVMQPYNSGGTIYGYGGNSGSAGSSGTSYFTRTDTDGLRTTDRRTIEGRNFDPDHSGPWAVQFTTIKQGTVEVVASWIAASGVTLYFKESLHDTASGWANALQTTITADVSIKSGNTEYAVPFYPIGGGYNVRISAESGASDFAPTIRVFIP